MSVGNHPYPQPGYAWVPGQPPPAQGYVANGPPHPQPVYGQPPPAQGYVANGPPHPHPGYGQPPPAQGCVANGPPHPQPGYGQPPPAQGYVANGPPHPQPGYGQPPPAQGYVANGPCFNYVPPKKFGDVKEHEGTNKWETSMLGAPCSEPCFCLAACCCPLCCTFLQRKKLLMDDWSRYVCCAGLCGDCNFCVCTGLEPCCLCLEVCCCLSCAVHGNRFMVLQHYNLENDWCDLMIILCGCICELIAVLIDLDDMSVVLDILFCMTISCLLAQHEHQMKVKGYPCEQGMR
ncbi:hypothetical protein ERJ75_000675900 [Trypanosoma vivax]|nr:hypothetical protein ERJ75_000675900 [Trypanosoma vivax]